MNTSDFIRKARELTDTLERFSITRSRLCAVTLHSGDGICVAFDRSDRSSVKLHRYMKNAYREDDLILSYEPTNKVYQSLIPCSEEVLADPAALVESANTFKKYLYSSSKDKYISDATDKSFHIVYTYQGVVVGAKSLIELENSVFRAEEHIKRIEAVSNIHSAALNNAGGIVQKMSESLHAMKKGHLYIRERK